MMTFDKIHKVVTNPITILAGALLLFFIAITLSDDIPVKLFSHKVKPTYLQHNDLKPLPLPLR